MIRFQLFFIVAAGIALVEDLAIVEREAARWYTDDYGEPWGDASSIRREDVQKHYQDGYRIHQPGGGIETGRNTPEEWAAVRDFFGADWVGSELARLKVEALSPTAVALWAQWLNRRSDGSAFSNCASYIAARTSDPRWQFTDLFIVECTALEGHWE